MERKKSFPRFQKWPTTSEMVLMYVISHSFSDSFIHVSEMTECN